MKKLSAQMDSHGDATQKILVKDLDQAALNWAVSKCEWHHEEGNWDGRLIADYVTDWANSGPLIDREKINIEYPREGYWEANMWLGRPMVFSHGTGATPIIAAMRCYVASKLGDEVAVPVQYLSDYPESDAAAPSM